MDIAILWPLVQDHITLDWHKTTAIGGIPYYCGQAASRLWVKVTAYATYAASDDAWIRSQFPGVTIYPCFCENTLHFSRSYQSQTPDICDTVEVNYTNNHLDISRYVSDLSRHEIIILWPLFYDNILPRDVKRIRDIAPNTKIIYWNFGIFHYPEDHNMTRFDHPESFMEILPWIDMLFLDQTEAQFVTQTKSIDEAIYIFQQYSHLTTIITKGSQGSIIITWYDTIEIPAYPPHAIADPTGAWDTYLAAFLVSEKFYTDLYQRGCFAAMAATISIERRGAFSWTQEDIEDRLRTSNMVS